MLTKAQFTQMLADELIANTMWSSEKKKAAAEEAASGNTKPWKRVEEHELLKMPPYCGKWNGKQFSRVKQIYQKYVCVTPNCN